MTGSIDRLGRQVLILTLIAVVSAVWVGTARAQSAFTPVAQVNEAVVTTFELQQRQLLLKALRLPAVTADGTLDILIDDKLKLAAAADAGIVP
ncbi:MAG: peptidylprolyl isomerase, partial [Pseudomonadota bacterium]